MQEQIAESRSNVCNNAERLSVYRSILPTLIRNFLAICKACKTCKPCKNKDMKVDRMYAISQSDHQSIIIIFHIFLLFFCSSNVKVTNTEMIAATSNMHGCPSPGTGEAGRIPARTDDPCCNMTNTVHRKSHATLVFRHSSRTIHICSITRTANHEYRATGPPSQSNQHAISLKGTDWCSEAFAGPENTLEPADHIFVGIAVYSPRICEWVVDMGGSMQIGGDFI